MLSSLGLSTVLTKYETNKRNKNILLGQSSISQNTTYGSSNFNMSENRKYQAISIYGVKGIYQGLWTSSNFGSSWSNTYTGSDNFTEVKMSLSGQYMYSNCQNVGRIYRSSNYGQSWTMISIGTNISRIECSKDGKTVYAVNFPNGEVYRSTNYGQTYSTIINSTITTNGEYLYLNEKLNLLFYTSTNTGNLIKCDLLTLNVTISKPNLNSSICTGFCCSEDGIYMYITSRGISNGPI